MEVVVSRPDGTPVGDLGDGPRWRSRPATGKSSCRSCRPASDRVSFAPRSSPLRPAPTRSTSRARLRAADRHGGDCSETTFDCVTDRAEVEFPASDPSNADSTKRVTPRASASRTRRRAASSARRLAVAAIAVAGLALCRGDGFRTGRGAGHGLRSFEGGSPHLLSVALLERARPGRRPRARGAPALRTARRRDARRHADGDPPVLLGAARGVAVGHPRSGRAGRQARSAAPQQVAGDPALARPSQVQRLDRGVYTVTWRVVSAVDGHATDGRVRLRRRASPDGCRRRRGEHARIRSRRPSRCSAAGCSCSAWSRCSGPRGERRAVRRSRGRDARSRRLARSPPPVSSCSRRRSAAARRRRPATCWSTSIGRALVWRALALARRRRSARRSPAGARRGAAAEPCWRRRSPRWPRWRSTSRPDTPPPAARRAVSIAFQSTHFAAAGFWIGGLAALLLGVRGAPSAAKAAAVRRFSTVAAAGLLVVVATGVVRAVEELGSWGELWSRPATAGRSPPRSCSCSRSPPFGALNRWRSVPRRSLRPRAAAATSRGELVLAAGRAGGRRRARERCRPRAAGLAAAGNHRLGRRLRARRCGSTSRPRRRSPAPTASSCRRSTTTRTSPSSRARQPALQPARRSRRRCDDARARARRRRVLRRLGREHGVRRPLGRDGSDRAGRRRRARCRWSSRRAARRSSSRSSAFRERRRLHDERREPRLHPDLARPGARRPEHDRR